MPKNVDFSLQSKIKFKEKKLSYLLESVKDIQNFECLLHDKYFNIYCKMKKKKINLLNFIIYFNYIYYLLYYNNDRYIIRAIIKILVMTFSYNSSTGGRKQQLMDNIKKYNFRHGIIIDNTKYSNLKEFVKV